MPTGPINPAKKTALLNVIKDNDCIAARYIQQKLINWEDGPQILFEYSKTFDCDPTYLDSILSIFTDSELTDQGIYYLKSSTTIINPSWVVKGTDVEIQVGTGMAYRELHVAYATTATQILIQDEVELDVLAIGGASEVDLLTVEPGSSVGVLVVKSCVPDVSSPTITQQSTLTLITEGSTIDNIDISSGSEYGGYECNLQEQQI